MKKIFALTLLSAFTLMSCYNMDLKEEMVIEIAGERRNLTLEDNNSVSALIALISANDGKLSLTFSDYGGFEKLTNLNTTLPSNDVRVVTEPGDIVLYQSSHLVIFYGSNSWSYTRIGKIDDTSNLSSFLKEGEEVNIDFLCV